MPNSTVVLTGEGFAPNSMVEVWLNSTPILLLTTNVGENGRFTTEFSIPADLAGGNHTFTFVGLAADGSELRTSVGVVIVDPRDVVSISDGDVEGISSGSSGSAGTDIGIALVVALVLAVLAFSIRRRRRGLASQSDSDASA
ncbi:MAG: hypothetical protein EB010_13560 [Acidimicrobiia bacterium]|nr:hypothetical protein [Acidimicrobiia bacterium]